MQIIEEQHEGVLLRERAKKGSDLLKECRLAGDRPDRPMLGEGGREGRTIASWPVAPEEFHPRPIRRRLVEVIAVPGEDQRTLLSRIAAERFRERRLADARLPADEDEA